MCVCVCVSECVCVLVHVCGGARKQLRKRGNLHCIYGILQLALYIAIYI